MLNACSISDKDADRFEAGPCRQTQRSRMSSPDELKSSPRYDRIVAASRQVAWDLGRSYVGVEHLFLAIVQDPT